MNFEELRLRYRPDQIRVLFVGESPPAGGTFFYKANSNLYRYTRKAFNYDGTSFLDHFKSAGCFLDDLCDRPVNKLSIPQRRKAWRESTPGLAERLKSYRPDSIVVVMRGIYESVQEAAEGAGLGVIPIDVLPFPALGNQNEYMTELRKLLERLQVK